MSEIQDAPPSNQWRLAAWFPELGEALLSKFKVIFDELVKFNKTLNLVAPKTIAMADALHFADGILASHVISTSPVKFKSIHDLGSGCGFPGLIFALLNPGIQVFLVEMDQKKCEFIRHIISAVAIPNATIVNSKIEDLKDGSVEVAMVRGLSTISKVIMPMRKSISKGGLIFHIKGEEWGMEVSEIPIQLCSMWSPGLVGEYRLPVGEMKFSVIKTDKIS
ncbi:MAG: 16S rRNA (guanine(527)-N(7))-methyltransferase RsmG [Proteobacteria bacterium]|nr:MAG: 16S rRNA (guanine(527)-N(7))-methyltransferase RsmG [Pseudomonadota bacterium]